MIKKVLKSLAIPFLFVGMVLPTLYSAYAQRAEYEPGVIFVKLSPTAVNSEVFKRRVVPSGTYTGLENLDKLNVFYNAHEFKQVNKTYKRQDLAERIGLTRWFKVTVPITTDIPNAIARYTDLSEVEYAEPNGNGYFDVVPNDTYHSYNWGHNNTAQLRAWDQAANDHTGPYVGTVGFDANAHDSWDKNHGYGDANIVIGIIDSGVDWDHPDLRIWSNSTEIPANGIDDDNNGYIDDVRGWDFGDGDNDPDDNCGVQGIEGHGTACSGIAAAITNNGIGVSGIAGGCTVMPIKIIDNTGWFQNLPLAIQYGADNGANVLSMSFHTGYSQQLQDAIDYAWNSGVTLLAASGNSNVSSIEYPASGDHVIAVGAASPCGDRKRISWDPNGVTCDNEVWWGSNYGSTTQDAADAIDLIAPTILPTTDIVGIGGYMGGSYYMYFNGTSCATPYAAGVCALILSSLPAATPDQVRQILVSSAQDVLSVESGSGWDRFTGYGLVNADGVWAIVDQLLSDNTTRVGTIGRWNGSSFPRFSPPGVFNFVLNSTEVFHGDPDIYSGEKYTKWNEIADVNNHKEFHITSQFDGLLVSNFQSTRNAIVKNAMFENQSISGGSILFRDPWLIDYADPNYGGNMRNRGFDAPFIAKSSPFNPNTSGSSPGYEYKGVLLNQPAIISNDPYYSLRASQFLTPQYTHRYWLWGNPLNAGDWIFKGWQTNGMADVVPDPNSANNIPEYQTNAVVFSGADAMVNANYKAHLHSNTPISTIQSECPTCPNSQRKLAIDSDGIHHLVYESAGRIWYTTSYDGTGNHWTPEIPLDDGLQVCRYPNITTSGTNVYVVWNQEGDVYLRVKTDPSYLVWGNFSSIGTGRQDCHPVITADSVYESFVIAYETDAGLHLYSDCSSCTNQINDLIPKIDAVHYPASAKRTTGYHNIAWFDNGDIYYAMVRFLTFPKQPMSYTRGPTEYVPLGHGNPIAVTPPSISVDNYLLPSIAWSWVDSDPKIVTFSRRSFNGWGSTEFFLDPGYHYWAPSRSISLAIINMEVISVLHITHNSGRVPL